MKDLNNERFKTPNKEIEEIPRRYQNFSRERTAAAVTGKSVYQYHKSGTRFLNFSLHKTQNQMDKGNQIRIYTLILITYRHYIFAPFVYLMPKANK